MIHSLDDLIIKYPKIFELLSDPFYRISSDVPDAWLQTIDWMCEVIRDYTDSNESVSPFQIQQIKEKYGGLRVYYNGGDDFCEGVVDMTERVIWNTCIECGTHSDLITTTGWISRICETCNTKNNKI